MTTHRKLKVFLIHADEDSETVATIFNKLSHEGWIEPWFDKSNLLTGHDWAYEINDAIEHADAVIVFLSILSVNKESSVQVEIKKALEIADQKPEGTIFFLPVRLENCVVPTRIKKWQWVDYFQAEDAYGKLLQSLVTRATAVGIDINTLIREKERESTTVISSESKSPDRKPRQSSLVPIVTVVIVVEKPFYAYMVNRLQFVIHNIAEASSVDLENIRMFRIEKGSDALKIKLPETVLLDLTRLLLRRAPEIFNHLDIREIYREDQPSVRIVVQPRKAVPVTLLNRKAMLEQFRIELRNNHNKAAIHFILGSGGIGKTFMVREMLEEARKQGIFAPDAPIDLFSTEYRHIDGIQLKIREIVEDTTGLHGLSSPFAGWVKGETDTSENFYNCLKSFCEKTPLVLAFDTFEALNSIASNWLFMGEPNGLQVPGLICIVASRYEKETLEIYRNNPFVEEKHILGFTLEEANDFYNEIVKENSLTDGDPYDDLLRAAGLPRDYSYENSIAWVVEITEGNPLLLEMVFRWLGTLLRDESLEDLTLRKFEEQLMEQVRELAERGRLGTGTGKEVSRPVYDTLLCMAYITRRFDEDFLRHFINAKLIHSDDPGVINKDIIDSLERYFFVKTRRGVGGRRILQLHDEMARLVREYLWPFIDMSWKKRDELYRTTIEFYDRLIHQSADEMKSILQSEQLYYMLKLDRDTIGLRRWFALSELKSDNIIKHLPDVIEEHIEYFSVGDQIQIHGRIAEMERNAGHIRQAVGHWERVQELGKKNGREDWVVDALVGLFSCRWMTDPRQALEEYLQPAQVICEKSFPERLALIYYETGFAYRQMQDFEKAVEWYERGIQRIQEFREDDILESILRNDVGYAYLILGKWSDAAKNLTGALEIREALWHQAERRLKAASDENRTQLLAERNQALLFVGLSRNTFGEYHRYVKELDEALADYGQAYGHFDAINNYYWQAKCLCARGETYRRLAWQAWEKKQEDSVIQNYLDKARQDVEESLYLCEKYQLDDERDTVYRRLGRIARDLGLMAYRQGEVKQAQERLEKAYAYFKQGLGYAERTNDTREELENLTELAFLADDSVVFYGRERVPNYLYRAVDELEDGLKKHMEDPQRIYLYPVFEALWQMEKAAIALAEENYDGALEGYVQAFKGLAVFPGYGHVRYRQHFGHLTQQIESLPKDEQERWCERFIEVWKNTKMPGRTDKTLAEDLLPDLVKWCNRLLKSTV